MNCFVLVSRLNGLVLDIERENNQPGAKVITYSKHGRINQLWYDDPATGTIRSKLNGFCLDIEGDRKLRVMPLQPGDPNQQWMLDPEGYIRNRVYRNLVLDILGANQNKGADVGMFDAHGKPNQLWNVEYVGGSAQPQSAYPVQGYPGQQGYPTQGYPQQTYPQSGYPQPNNPQQGYPKAADKSTKRREFYVVSEMNGKVLDVKGGNGNPGDDIVMWSIHEQKANNQLWYIDQQGFIRSVLNDFAIDGAANTKIEVQPFNGGPTQQWAPEGRKIINRGNGECLDVYRGRTSDGATVGSYKWNDSPNQHWRLQYV